VELDETLLGVLSGAANATIADPQGVGTIIDDDAPSLSSNELVHGSVQTASLAATPAHEADRDYYRLAQRLGGSYEVVVDATSGDVQPIIVERLGADNVSVLQTGAAIGAGSSVSLRWENPLAAAVLNQHISLRSGGCTTSCGNEDGYRIRAYETTYAIPRFNNSATQQTVLLLQSSAGYTINGTLHFWSPLGALLHTEPFSLPAKGLLALNTATLGVLSGQSGSVSLPNDGRYADVTGKAVALEPATGFTFDTSLSQLPR